MVEAAPLDCGHPPVRRGQENGIAYSGERTVCYPCATREVREAIASGAGKFSALVCRDGLLRARTGGTLARIIRTTPEARRNTPNGGPVWMVTIWARVPDGRVCWGRYNTALGGAVTMRFGRVW